MERRELIIKLLDVVNDIDLNASNNDIKMHILIAVQYLVQLSNLIN